MAAAVVVPELPPGYTLIVNDPGRGWRSFGWRLKLEGELVAVRFGDGSELEAGASAWAHHRAG